MILLVPTVKMLTRSNSVLWILERGKEGSLEFEDSEKRAAEWEIEIEFTTISPPYLKT